MEEYRIIELLELQQTDAGGGRETENLVFGMAYVICLIDD